MLRILRITKLSTVSIVSANKFTWVDKEAAILIERAYRRHLVENPPKISTKELEKLEAPVHFKPVDYTDKFLYASMRLMRVFTHAFFRKSYNHHAVVLETVAAVPGIVGAAARHLRSLRNMKRDNGWIGPLQEEAENERMHLLIWMKVTEPSKLERFLVILAQGVYLNLYVLLYITSPRSAHRFVGYLEEEAHAAYTSYLHAIDSGEIANEPAPEIAVEYYSLPKDATIRDVVLHVRADESMHRDFNHLLANKYFNKEQDMAI